MADDYDTIRRELEKAVRRACPAWLGDLAEDLVQMAMIRLFEVVRRSDEERSFSHSYLSKTAYCALVDEIRRHQRRREIPLDPEVPEHQPASMEPDPEARSAGKELGEAIEACLKEMAASRRQAVVLYFEGHTIKEIAQLVQVRTKKADNLVYRGLADLRKCLKRKGLEP